MVLFNIPPQKTSHTEQSKFVSFEPIDILLDFSAFVTEIPSPNMKGVRWNYADAIAKSLLELEPWIIKIY